MGVIDKLNALDDKAGIPRAPTAESWARSARWWWLNLSVAVFLAVAGVVADAPSMAFGAVGNGFIAGCLYKQRQPRAPE